MNNNILLIGGVLITLIAVGSVMIDGDGIEESYEKISDDEKKEILTTGQPEVTQIVYDQDVKQGPIPEKRRVVVAARKADEKPLPLGLSTYDAKRKFKISVYDPDQMYKPSEAPRAKKYVTVEGRIDGSKFTMKVPDYFIENPDNVKLRLTNSDTKESKTIPASFLYNLTTANEKPSHHVVSMSSRSPADFEYTTRPQITPPAFGQ